VPVYKLKTKKQEGEIKRTRKLRRLLKI